MRWKYTHSDTYICKDSLMNTWVYLRAPQSDECAKEHTYQYRKGRFDPWVGKIPWRRKWQPTAVFLPGESHGQQSLGSIYIYIYSSWGH